MTRPALLLASSGFIDDVARRLREAGIQDAVASHDTAAIYDWMTGLLALQGISDRAAFAFDAKHGGVTHAQVADALAAKPSCPRLRCYWAFECGYRKGAGICSEPSHFRTCPLPQQPLRKGVLNVAAFGLALFIRDLCIGDIVGWIDGRLAAADPGPDAPDRAARMRRAVLTPLCNVPGTGRKLWSMVLADLLLAGDPDRERWMNTGASMIAVDTLVHSFLHRTGTLDRLGAEHPYGECCYRPGGCADVIQTLSERVDADEFNPTFPATFPRFVQHAIWQFCAASGRDICNGNRIQDRAGCNQRLCPVGGPCDRVPLHSG